MDLRRDTDLEIQMSYKSLLYTVEEGIATITLNRPEEGNGFNVWVCEEILQALQEATDEPVAKVVIIRAEGKIFSTGGDLAEMKRLSDIDDQATMRRIVELVADITWAIKKMPKPVIVSANGAVAGAAFNIALAADFCIASTDTKFIQAFVGVGLIPDAGGLFLLSRSVGMNRAMQWAMTGEAVTAEKGLECGFVYKVCDPEKIEQITRRTAKRLVVGPQLSFKAMKEVMLRACFKEWEEYIAFEIDAQSSLGKTEDFKEGVTAFAERRRPVFRGK